MNYIGSKHKLTNFIKTSILKVVGNCCNEKVLAELFGGTGVISRSFKREVKQLIVNDIEPYSYVLLKNYIGNHEYFTSSEMIDELNSIKPVEGFIYKNYCSGSGSGRQYFSDENGKKIDAIRLKIEEWKSKDLINQSHYYFLLASLLESADKVANTASVYGAFLKFLKKSAQKPIILAPAVFEENNNEHLVFNLDANELIKKIEGDILYLDPPYNQRQYGANYHMLNTIALYDDFEPKGKTGLRDYVISNYCSQKTVKQSFEELIKNARFKYIFLSYNNEGLMGLNDVKDIMSTYGTYDLITTDYQRFKADRDENRTYKANNTTEYLHILIKDESLTKGNQLCFSFYDFNYVKND